MHIDIKRFTVKLKTPYITRTEGQGKTRLTLQTGADMIDEFANGVWLVELTSVSDPSLCKQVTSVFSLIRTAKIDWHQSGRTSDNSMDNWAFNFWRNWAEQFSSDKTKKVQPLYFPVLFKTKIPWQVQSIIQMKGTSYESVQLFIETHYQVNPDFKGSSLLPASNKITSEAMN